MVAGQLVVNEEVFVDIAQGALQKVEDVIRQQKKGALSELGRLFSGRFSSKVSVSKTEAADNNPGTVSFELKLVLVYGVNIPDVANRVREEVAKDVTAITGYDVERVDIVVEGLVRPEEQADQN